MEENLKPKHKSRNFNNVGKIVFSIFPVCLTSCSPVNETKPLVFLRPEYIEKGCDKTDLSSIQLWKT